MANFQYKADLFSGVLRDIGAEESFERVDLDSRVTFRTIQRINSGRCIIYVNIDDTLYSTVHYHLLTLQDLDKKEAMLDLLNELNSSYKTLKFFINKDNEVMGHIVYSALKDEFNPSLFFDLIIQSFNSIREDDYSRIMKIILE